MRSQIVFAAIAFAVVAITGVAASPINEWTFINYYATNNFLESFTFKDLNKFTASPKISDRVSAGWLLDTKTMGSYNVAMDGSTWKAPGVVMEHIRQPNMSSTDVLAQHVNAVIKQYPARNYAFWYSGHSSSWYVMPEQINEGEDDEIEIWLGVPQIRKVLARTGVKFELLVFDSCLMSVMESQYEFRDIAHYTLAYETYGPWEGYMSPQLIDTFQDTRLSTVNKLKRIADNMIARNAAAVAGDNLETADAVVLDLTEIGDLGKFVASLKLTHADFKYSNESRNLVDWASGSHDLYDVITNLPPSRLSAQQRTQFIRLFHAVVVYYVQNADVPRNDSTGEVGSESYNAVHHGLSIVKTLQYDLPDAEPYRQLELQPVQQPKMYEIEPESEASFIAARPGVDKSSARPIRRRYTGGRAHPNKGKHKLMKRDKQKIPKRFRSYINAALPTAQTADSAGTVALPTTTTTASGILTLLAVVAAVALSAWAVWKWKRQTVSDYAAIPEASTAQHASATAI